MRGLLIVLVLCACDKGLTVEVDAENLAACERVPRCVDMRVPDGHQLCRDAFVVRRRASAADAFEFNAPLDGGR